MSQGQVQQGVALALEARQRGYLDDQALALVFAYYDNEGAESPLPPAQVLGKLGGLSAEQLGSLTGQPPANQGQPFNDRLTLLGILGEGGMGAVYRAYDRILRRVVAVKLIRSERLEAEQAQRHLARFEREARAMAKVRHPYCASIYDAGLSPRGQPYLVMEFVAGTTLAGLIAGAVDSGQLLDPRRVAQLGKQVAEGLQACHEAGVVHRDVKPGNVLIDGDGQPRLTDFGIALDDQDRTRLTAEMAAIGTLNYLPPEQAGGERVDARSDVYALGATLYEALTGRTVFEGQIAVVLLKQIVGVVPDPLSQHRADVPRDLEMIVLKCLEKEPDDRYPSAQALALDLARFLAGDPVHARPLSGWTRATRRAWRYRRPLGLLLLLLVAIGGSLLLYAWRAKVARRVRAEADLAAAETDSDLEAAWASLTRLVTLDEPGIARKAEAALRRVDGRKSLRGAARSLERHRSARRELRALRQEIETLRGRVQEEEQYVPVSKSPLKQALFKKEDELVALGRKAEQMLNDADRLVAEASVSLSPAEVGLVSAWVCIERARILEKSDPRVAEELYSRASELDSEGTLNAQLARAAVFLTSRPPAKYTLSRYAYDSTRGHQTAEVIKRGQTPSTFRLGTGDYLVEVRARGHVSISKPLHVRRGQPRTVELQLLETSVLGPLAEQVVAVPAGSTQRPDSHTRVMVPAFFMKRHETTLEEWLSFLLAQPALNKALLPFLHVGGRYGPIDLAVLKRNRKQPCSGISRVAMQSFLSWLQKEVELLGLALRVRFPSLGQYSRATRGELNWRFPWGSRIDPSFALRSDRRIGVVGQQPIDRSPFGVLDLAASRGEVTRDPVPGLKSAWFAYGTSSNGSSLSLRLSYSHSASISETTRSDGVGFRYVLEPRGLSAPDRASLLLARTLGRKSLAALTTGRPDRAQLFLTKALHADRKDSTLWLRRGKVRLMRSDLWGALMDYSQAIILSPKLVEAWYERGKLRLRRQEFAKAVVDFTKVLELDPKNHESWAGRAQARAALKQFNSAVSDMETFLKRAPFHKQSRAAKRLLDQWKAKKR